MEKLSLSIFQKDGRTFQGVTLRGPLNAGQVCEKVVAQYDVVNGTTKEIMADPRFLGLFVMKQDDVSRVPDTENVGDFIKRQPSDKVLKFALMQRESKEYCFLKQKGVSASIAAPPPPAGAVVTSASAEKLREGWLRKKKEGKQWKRRWVKLMEHMVTYWKSPNDKAPKGTIDLDPGCTLSLKLIKGIRTLLLATHPRQGRQLVYMFALEEGAQQGQYTIDDWYVAVSSRIIRRATVSSGNHLVSSAGSSPVTSHGSPVASPHNSVNNSSSPLATSAMSGGVVAAAAASEAQSAAAAQKQADNAIFMMRLRTFTNWLNAVLDKKRLQIKNVLQDMGTGVPLVALAELLFRAIPQQYHTDTNLTPQQKAHNIQTAINMLNDRGVYLRPLGLTDLAEGTKKVLDLVWDIIWAYHADATGLADDDVVFRSELLQRCQQILGRWPDVKVDNFTTSWADGFAFAHLLAHFAPNGIDLAKLNRSMPAETLNAAFRLANRHLNVPMLLSTGDMTSGHIDEQSVMAYVGAFFDCTDPRRKKIFIPPPVVPISARVLMDRLMDEPDNVFLMQEISRNEQARKQLKAEREKEAEGNEELREEARRKKEEAALIEAERVRALEAALGRQTRGASPQAASPSTGSPLTREPEPLYATAPPMEMLKSPPMSPPLSPREPKPNAAAALDALSDDLMRTGSLPGSHPQYQYGQQLRVGDDTRPSQQGYQVPSTRYDLSQPMSSSPAGRASQLGAQRRPTLTSSAPNVGRAVQHEATAVRSASPAPVRPSSPGLQALPPPSPMALPQPPVATSPRASAESSQLDSELAKLEASLLSLSDSLPATRPTPSRIETPPMPSAAPAPAVAKQLLRTTVPNPDDPPLPFELPGPILPQPTLDAEAEDIFEELKAQSRRIDADYHNNKAQEQPIFSTSQRGSMFDPSLTIDVELQRIADTRVANPHDSVTSIAVMRSTTDSASTSTRGRGDTLDKIMAELVES